MNNKARFIVSFTFAVIVFMIATAGSEALASESKIFQERNWLLDTSPFIQEFDLATGKPAMSSRGGFGLGTGYVFAIIGVGIPQNTLTNLAGPNYEKSESIKFHNVSAQLLQKTGENAEVPCPFTYSRLRRVTGTSVTRLEEAACGVYINWINFAPFGSQSIFRVISLRNNGSSDINGIVFQLSAMNKEGASLPSGNMSIEQAVDEKKMSVSFLPIGDINQLTYSATDGIINVEIGSLSPGEEAVLYSSVTISDTTKPAPPLPATEEEVYGLLDTNRNEWHAWKDGALDASSSDGVIGALFDNTLVMLKTQTPMDTKGIALLARYSGMWCRDTFGPVRLFLPSGKFNEVRNITSFYDYATRLIGFRNRYPVDLDLPSAPDEVDWESLTPQQGDDPNLLILQYYHYYMATMDTGFIKEHYGFLRRNMLGQEHTDYRLPFHSDETYQVYVMMSESASMHDFYSADTGFEFTMAAAALSEMAGAIGEAEDAELFARMSDECRKRTEEYYWDEERGYYIPYIRKDTLKPPDSPFANINLRPLWIGYGDPADPAQRCNLMMTYKNLVTKKKSMKSTSKTSYYTGMTPGLLLYNLKATGAMKQADTAYKFMTDRVMSPTGEFAEAYDGKDRWMDYAHDPNIYRPWETSINVEAVLFYVTGLKYDHKNNVVTLTPHLPAETDWVKFDRLHAGPNVFSLYLNKQNDGNMQAEIVNTGDAPMQIELWMEPASGIERPQSVEIVNYEAYGRDMWRVSRTLAPGEHFAAKGGFPD